LDPIRLIEAIRSTLADPETAAAEVRAAACHLRQNGSLAMVLEACLAEDFVAKMLAGARSHPGSDEWAWLTLAAAGGRRTRQCLAWYASKALDPDEVAGVLAGAPRNSQRACRRRAARAMSREGRAAWLLLASLRRRELRRLVEGHPAFVARYRRLRHRGSSNGGSKARDHAVAHALA
jgi:hypothetical protein